MGYLVYKSGFLPKALGVMLMLDCFAVLVWFFQFFFLPSYPAISYPCYAVSFIAEFSLTLIPIAMVFLSRLLKYEANRWVNIIGGLITILWVVGMGSPTLTYIFFASIEVVCALVIIGKAWKWKPATNELLSAA